VRLIAGVYLLISRAYTLSNPIVRKKHSKTISNKFVRKGLNAIFVKIWFVF